MQTCVSISLSQQKEEKKKKRKSKESEKSLIVKISRSTKEKNDQEKKPLKIVKISRSALELKRSLLQSQFSTRDAKTEFPACVVCLISLGVCTIVLLLSKMQMTAQVMFLLSLCRLGHR